MPIHTVTVDDPTERALTYLAGMLDSTVEDVIAEYLLFAIADVAMGDPTLSAIVRGRGN